MNLFNILIMKKMVTYFKRTMPLDRALAAMLKSTYTAVPVIDENGKYEGVVSEGDFLRGVIKYGLGNLSDYTIGDILCRDSSGAVLNTAKNGEIMEKILDRNFLSIIDDRGCFIGIVTRKGIISYLQGAR